MRQLLLAGASVLGLTASGLAAHGTKIDFTGGLAAEFGRMTAGFSISPVRV
jgi:hypothetical protein